MEEELLWQKRRAQEREDERRRQEAAEQLRRERERAIQQQLQWSVETIALLSCRSISQMLYPSYKVSFIEHQNRTVRALCFLHPAAGALTNVHL